MKLTFRILLILSIICSFSCKKEFEDTQRKTILLTKPSGWVSVKTELKTADDSWIDVTGTPLPTSADDVLLFDPWFTWALGEGPTKLPQNPQLIATGTWSFTDNDTKIKLEGGNLMEIVELSETKLVTIVVNGSATNRYTFEHP